MNPEAARAAVADYSAAIVSSVALLSLADAGVVAGSAVLLAG